MSKLTDHIKKSINRDEARLNKDKNCLYYLLREEAIENGFKAGVTVKPKNSEQTYEFYDFAKIKNSIDLDCECWYSSDSTRSPYLVTLSVDNLEIVNNELKLIGGGEVSKETYDFYYSKKRADIEVNDFNNPFIPSAFKPMLKLFNGRQYTEMCDTGLTPMCKLDDLVHIGTGSADLIKLTNYELNEVE